MSEFWEGLDGQSQESPLDGEVERAADSQTALDKLEQGDWDPEEGEREYYRHVQTGDRGWRVLRGGVNKIRLDRGAHETCLPLRRDHWEREAEHHPLDRAQLAMVAFEADRKLCFALGLHGLARLEWAGLSQQHRRAWMLEGPTKPPIRAALYRAIFEVLEPLCED